MKMNEHFCEQVIAPGVVVSVRHSSDLECSTWAITVPYSHWRGRSRPDVIARFDECSAHYPLIPLLEFTNAEEWCLRFGQFPNNVKPLCWLEDFLPADERRVVPTILRECSYRDGSRYNRTLLMWLSMIARGASKDFTSDELKEECVGVKEQIVHSRAIRQWRRENPKWREWKTVYEPGHNYYFALF